MIVATIIAFVAAVVLIAMVVGSNTAAYERGQQFGYLAALEEVRAWQQEQLENGEPVDLPPSVVYAGTNGHHSSTSSTRRPE